MTKSKNTNYLETLLQATSTARTKSDLSRITGLSIYIINKVLDENPEKSQIILDNLAKNKKSRRPLTPEQQEIFNMFMKNIKNEKLKKENEKKMSKLQQNLISLKFLKKSDCVRLKLRNNLYNSQKIVTSDKEIVNTRFPILRIDDNFYSLAFYFNKEKGNVLIFKHLRIINFNDHDNAEVVYYKRIYSHEQVSSVKYVYRSFINEFLNSRGYTFN